jgi:hypothetical protein
LLLSGIDNKQKHAAQKDEWKFEEFHSWGLCRILIVKQQIKVQWSLFIQNIR